MYPALAACSAPTRCPATTGVLLDASSHSPSVSVTARSKFFAVCSQFRISGAWRALAAVAECPVPASRSPDAGLQCLHWLYQPAPCKGATMSTGHPASHIAALPAQAEVDREAGG